MICGSGQLRSLDDLLELVLQIGVIFGIASAVYASSYLIEIVSGAIAFSCFIGIIIRFIQLRK
jgi:hypothetical protein